MIHEENLKHFGYERNCGRYKNCDYFWNKWILTDDGKKAYCLHLLVYNFRQFNLGEKHIMSSARLYYPDGKFADIDSAVNSSEELYDVEGFYRRIYLQTNAIPDPYN